MCSWSWWHLFSTSSHLKKKKPQKPSSNGIWMGIQPASQEPALGTSVPSAMPLETCHLSVSKGVHSLAAGIVVCEEFSSHWSAFSWCMRPLFVFSGWCMNPVLGQYPFLPAPLILNGLSELTAAVSACIITAFPWAEQDNAPSLEQVAFLVCPHNPAEHLKSLGKWTVQKG